MTQPNDARRPDRAEELDKAPDATDETSTDAELVKRRLDRRRFIAAGAATGAGAVTIPLVAAQEGGHQEGTPHAVDPLTEVGTPVAEEAGRLAGFAFFTPFQAAIVAAAAERLIPSDDNGPGATEAGVVYFIDRQLRRQEHFTSFRGPRYAIGPFIPGEPTQGDQSALEMQNRWRLGIEGMEAYAQELFGSGFAELEPDQQDQVLRDMEAGVPETFGTVSIQGTALGRPGSGQEASVEEATGTTVGAEAFFQLLHSYVLAGFFADPVHGGNRDMVGWKLIGFPGAQGFVYHDWILRYGEEFTGGYQSLAAYQDQFTGED